MKEWYKDWFSSDEYLNLYPHRDDEDADKLLEMILREIKPSSDALILDAACGAGRHVINLVARGFRVVGFDLSKSLLRVAKQDASERGVPVDLFCGDLRRISLRAKFDIILNLFTSFGYFQSDQENFSFIRSAYDMLNENGFYVLDFLNSRYIHDNLIPETVRELDSKMITEKRMIRGDRVVKQITIQNGSNENSYVESVQLYRRDKIVSEFERIGFKYFKEFGDYDGSMFNPDQSQRLILFFQK